MSQEASLFDCVLCFVTHQELSIPTCASILDSRVSEPRLLLTLEHVLCGFVPSFLYVLLLQAKLGATKRLLKLFC